MRDDDNKAAECESLLRLLGDAPTHGLTIDEIQADLCWPHRIVHRRLIDLGRQVTSAKKRINKGEKLTYYFIRRD